MDFFQAQENARTSTFRLLIMFGMAIVSLILITDIIFFIAFGFLNSETGGSNNISGPELNTTVIVLVSCAVLAVVLIGSTYKYLVLSSGGGRLIAESMGGRLLLPATNDLHEKRLLNVVEEMAIASGTPVPQVYVLDEEPAINAFAAGLSTGDAVIGVTRGTLETLTRDELQGVIAHEYSHILNGDMSLNIRLIGILHGILVLGIIGYFILRSTGRSRNKNSGGLVIFGVGLIVIGYGGTFFGNLIKSSISRQREYLADASAVQFTRNPEGIAGALKKIGGMPDKSRLQNENAAEMSHAYFAEGISNFLGSLTATHPPLEQRIRRIDPAWDGEFIDASASKAAEVETTDATVDDKREKIAQAVTSTIALQSVMNSIGNMGNPGKAEIETSRSIIKAIPEEIYDAVHNPYGARALIYCLVINRDEAVKNRQLEYVKKHGDRGIYDLCLRYLPLVDGISRRYRLPLIDMSLPALRELSENQYKMFKRNLDELVAADANLDLFEWSLQKILYKHLDAAFFKVTLARGKYANYDSIKEDCRMVFSVLAYAGHKKPADADAAFHAAIEVIKLSDLVILDKSSISFTKIDNSLEHLLMLKPLLKRDLLQACLACAMTDNVITTAELELIRAIAVTLDCPIPPVDPDA